MANKNFSNAKDQQISEALSIAYEAMNEKGYNSINQLSDYILCDDEHYLTSYKNARKLMRACDREILRHLLKYYLEN